MCSHDAGNFVPGAEKARGTVSIGRGAARQPTSTLNLDPEALIPLTFGFLGPKGLLYVRFLGLF